MKKFLFALLACAAFATTNVSAQQTIGGTLNFDADMDAIGLGARYSYAWGNVRLAPEVVFFFPSNALAVDLNANVHYTFNVAPRFNLYPLGGLNIDFYSWSVKANGVKVKGNDTSFGLNLGLGGEYEFSNLLSGYMEFKGIVADGSRAVLTFGLARKF